MPWVTRGNQHVFVNFASAPTTTPTQTTVPSSNHAFAVTGAIPTGTFVEWTGEQPSPHYWGEQVAMGNFDRAETLVQVAGVDSPTTAGVVVGTNQVKTTGTVLAWVIRKKRELPLSGLYATSVNGAPKGNTAIVQLGQTFLMCKSKDDALEKLVQQFKELTNE